MVPKDDYAPIIYQLSPIARRRQTEKNVLAPDRPRASSLKRSDFNLTYVQVTLDLNF